MVEAACKAISEHGDKNVNSIPWPDGWSSHERDCMRKSTRAGLEAIAPMLVPDGWQLVPTKPTSSMVRAGAFWNTECDMSPEYDALHSIWNDMLAAAPSPTNNEGE